MKLNLTNEAWLLSTDQASLTQQLSAAHAIPAPREASSLSADELAKATALARRIIASEKATVYSATATVSAGKRLNSNTGQPCTSGRLLHIKLIGSFPHTATTGHPVAPGEPPPDFTVRAAIITADARTGLACLIGAQTRENGEPKATPNATVLDIH